MRKKQIFAVLDTNVLVSALLTKSPTAATARLIDALYQNAFCTLFNDEILKEYEEVLGRAKFDFEPDLVNGIIDTIRDNGLYTDRSPSNEHFQDLDDVVFYEVALAKKGAYVVTGNIKDFPRKPIVVTPAEMVTILEDYGLIEKNTKQ